MKLITAVVQPECLESVKEALKYADVQRMTVSRVKGCGKQEGFREHYRGKELNTVLLDKVRFEIAINDEYEKAVIEAIVKGAQTGEVGDGKIFVTELTRCVRIRDGYEGTDAIG